MHADIIQENNLTHTKWPKHSEWTQWDEAESGRQNLWAAQTTVQLYRKLHNTTWRRKSTVRGPTTVHIQQAL